MNQKEIFLKDKENCDGPFYHIMDNIQDPALIEIDELYGVADSLSVQNSERHRKILLALSLLGTAIVVVFFLYYEGEMHNLILLCVLLLFILILVHKQSKRLNCHKKYLEYRVLAETLRVQFFLSFAGLKIRVVDILPWFIKKAIPFIEEILLDLPLHEINEKRPILDYWIRDQKEYHKTALLKSELKKEKEERISKIAIYVTITAYLAALLFELFMIFYSPVDINAHLIRISLKIVIGIMSVSLLFLENYYGKMSLYERIEDHKRMISLYEKIESDVMENGETEEILLILANEFLVENSTWYAYQSKNSAELVL